MASSLRPFSTHLLYVSFSCVLLSSSGILCCPYSDEFVFFCLYVSFLFCFAYFFQTVSFYFQYSKMIFLQPLLLFSNIFPILWHTFSNFLYAFLYLLSFLIKIVVAFRRIFKFFKQLLPHFPNNN